MDQDLLDFDDNPDYILFAAMGASTRTLIIESIVARVFLLFAVFGLKKELLVGSRCSCRARRL